MATSDIKVQTGSQSSQHSLASLGDKDVPQLPLLPIRAKVLVIYVGGTIGMKKDEDGGLYKFSFIHILHFSLFITANSTSMIKYKFVKVYIQHQASVGGKIGLGTSFLYCPKD